MRLIGTREIVWRSQFLLHRVATSPRTPSFLSGSRASERFENQLARFPRAVVPYLNRYCSLYGASEAETLATKLASGKTTNASLLVEIAKYHYVRGELARGDDYLERAKQLDPTLPRIYDEEAWNQRARGNVHREIEALQNSILLSPDKATRYYWQIWLGEALIRQGNFDQAWEHLQRYSQLPKGDQRLLSVAYCARQLNLREDVVSAYRRAVDNNLAKAAYHQLRTYHRPDEVVALLYDATNNSAETAGAPTGLLEVAFTAYLQLGDVASAVEALESAARRADQSSWVLSTLAMTYELIDDSRASSVYAEIDDTGAANDLVRFRKATLIQAEGDIPSAVKTYLNGHPKLVLPDVLPPEEVDPQLPSILDRLKLEEYSAHTIPLLYDVVRRASSPELLTPASLLLASQLSAAGRWEEAWDAIRIAQILRLPVVSINYFPPLDGLTDVSENMIYAEFCESEPIDTETVLWESSLGAGTSCNPLAMCLEMLSDKEYLGKRHVWSINADATIHPSLRNRDDVVFVQKGSIGYLRYLASAGAIVNNSTIESYFTKREGQRYLNTWHGIPWKTMGRDNKSEPFAYGNISRNFLHADVVIGPDPHTIDVLSRGHDVDELAWNAFTLSGSPRNDLSINLPDNVRADIRQQLGVSSEGSLALFMPTWKGLFNERNAEVDAVINAAREMTSPGITVALRAHHYVREAFTRMNTLPSGIVLVPDHFDTNELIGAADAIVTDFSSVLFDAAAVGVPVIKLVSEIDHYASQRGLYFSPEEVPGANADCTSEVRDFLIEAVNNQADFIARYRRQTSKFNKGESGNSARHAVRLLYGMESAGGAVPPPIKRPVLISTGGLPANGITRSARNLLVALRDTDYSPYLIPGSNTLQGADDATLHDIKKNARIIVAVGRPAGTVMERKVLSYFSSRRYQRSSLSENLLISGRTREANRRFGNATFYAAVEYSSYSATDIALVGYGAPVEGGKRVSIFHNEMWKEVQEKFPRLAAGMRSLDGFDYCASVSNGVRDYNARTLNEHFGVPVEKHITIENTINVDEIVAAATAKLPQQDINWYASEGAHTCIVARLSHEKNHEQLFTVLAENRNRLKRPVKITCLGAGPLRSRLERQIEKLGISDLVRLRGQVNAPESHIRAAGSLLLPSLHEGQPLVLLEALTVGVPVVATETPGSRSVLQDGKYGVLVPLSSEGLLEALQCIADQRLISSTEFNPEAFTEHSLNMFIEAISS